MHRDRTHSELSSSGLGSCCGSMLPLESSQVKLTKIEHSGTAKVLKPFEFILHNNE